jgi:DNA topoisomerase IA
MELVIAEKPSVAQSIAAVLGATQRKDGYLEGNEYLVSWCVGHLVELAQPESYEEAWKKWSYDNLPIIVGRINAHPHKNSFFSRLVIFLFIFKSHLFLLKIDNFF